MTNPCRVLYVGHRYHTNQIPIMKGWNEYNVKPMFLAQYEGVGEVHDHVIFQLMRLSLFCKPLFYYYNKRFNPAVAESKKIKAFIPSLRKTILQIKAYKPDIVIIREYTKGNAIVVLACKILGIKKVIMYVQDPLYKGNYQRHSLRTLFRKMFFPSVSFTPVLRKGKDRITTNISNAYDSPKYFVPLVFPAPREKRDDYCKDGIIHILDIGKYRDYKNHFFLIDAIKELKDVSRIKVSIIGQLSNSAERDYYDRLNEYIKIHHLDEVIKLYKEVSYNEMDLLYNQNDILVLCSRNETAGMVILEAMAHGLLVISSIHCGLASYLEKYNCGLLFSIDNPKRLATQLEGCIETPNIIRENGTKSQSVVTDNFSFHSYLRDLNNITEKEYNYSLLI